jgi:hypothetical protein
MTSRASVGDQFACHLLAPDRRLQRLDKPPEFCTLVVPRNTEAGPAAKMVGGGTISFRPRLFSSRTQSKTVAVGTVLQDARAATGWPGAVTRPRLPQNVACIFPHYARQKVRYSAARACSSRYWRYSFGRSKGNRSLTRWKAVHRTSPFQLRLLSILRQ